jgi:prepilin-type N-terminal cleavage/methylation domain-containing protein
MTRRLRRLLRRQEGGYSLIEMVLVMAILGTILGALSTVFVEGTRAELHANNRFQAQLNATSALDRLRRDVHCASAASISGATMTLTGCTSGTRYWCTVTSTLAPTEFALYRSTTSPCDATGKQYADYLTSSTPFTYVDHTTTTLAKVHVDLPVNVSPGTTIDRFELTDDLVLRNSSRS